MEELATFGNLDQLSVDAVAEGVRPGLGSQKDEIELAAIKAYSSNRPLKFTSNSLPYNTDSLSLPVDLVIMMEPDVQIKRVAGATGGLFTTLTATTRFHIIGGGVDNNSSTSAVIDLPAGSADVALWKVNFTGMGTSGEALNITHSASLRSTNIVVDDCTFEGSVAVSNQNCITAPNPNFLRVHKCRFTNTGGINTTGAGLTAKVFVTHNEFDGVNASNMLIRPQGSGEVRRVLVDNNISTTAGVPLGKGLCAIGEQVLGTAGSTLTKDITVTNNTVKYFYGTAITVGGGVTPGRVEDVTVSNNKIDGSNLSDVFEDVSPGNSSIGINLVDNDDFTVASNTVKWCGRSGIRLVGCQRGSVGVNTVRHCVNGTGYTSPTGDTEGGIALFASTRPCVRISIGTNVVSNTGVSAWTLASGIQVGASSLPPTDITISGANQCFDDRTPKFQAYGVKIGASGAAANQPVDVLVSGNDLRGNLTGSWFSTALASGHDKGHAIFNNKGDALTPLEFSGPGTPEAFITAPIGSLYRRNDGGATTTLYVKTSGIGNTGWTAK